MAICKMTSPEKNILPARLDPQAMLDQKHELTGSVSAKSMMRLKNAVVSMSPAVAVGLRFSSGLYGLLRVTGWIRHELWLRCERCLEKVRISLQQPLDVYIKPASKSLPETADAPEFYEYDGKSLELAGLIEDELLLALPLAPKHEDISLCDQNMVTWLAGKVPTEEKDSPFSILKR